MFDVSHFQPSSAIAALGNPVAAVAPASVDRLAHLGLAVEQADANRLTSRFERVVRIARSIFSSTRPQAARAIVHLDR